MLLKSVPLSSAYPRLERFVTSMHEVVNSDTKIEAIRSIVRLCSVQFEAPAAAWHDAPDEAALLLDSSCGLGCGLKAGCSKRR